jgi:hypothetical protein
MPDTPVATADPWAPAFAYAEGPVRGQRPVDAARIARDALRLAPHHSGTPRLSAPLALRHHRQAEALTWRRSILARQPRDIALPTARATALRALVRPAEAGAWDSMIHQTVVVLHKSLRNDGAG